MKKARDRLLYNCRKPKEEERVLNYLPISNHVYFKYYLWLLHTNILSQIHNILVVQSVADPEIIDRGMWLTSREGVWGGGIPLPMGEGAVPLSQKTFSISDLKMASFSALWVLIFPCWWGGCIHPITPLDPPLSTIHLKYTPQAVKYIVKS